MLEVGTKAPEFTLEDKNGMKVSLKDFAGKKVVLYFYPKDLTPGCTRQACAFRDNYSEYEKKGVVVIGVSKDSVKSHANFASKKELPFILLSDPELEVIKAYDVWKGKNMFGIVALGVIRATYVIDEQGLIEKVYPKANPDTNAEEILAYLNK